jgi:A/G-specific adenine glycosylase
VTRASLVASFDPIVHVFTHLRLTMHTYHYRIDVGDEVGDRDEESLVCSGLPVRKWVATGDMEGETLSTGMRKCWGLVAGR